MQLFKQSIASLNALVCFSPISSKSYLVFTRQIILYVILTIIEIKNDKNRLYLTVSIVSNDSYKGYK